MIINHSDLIGITIDPFKNRAPLIVDATSTGLSSDECHACSPTNILASLCTCRFAWTTQARCPHVHSDNINSGQVIEIG